MNKNKALLTLALPLLILCACGKVTTSVPDSKEPETSEETTSSETKVTSESSSSESSSSESSMPEHDPYEVNDKEWGEVFATFAKNYNATLFIYDSKEDIDSSAIFRSKTLFDGDAAHLDMAKNSSPSGLDTGFDFANEYYYSRSEDKIYMYTPSGDGQYKRSLLQNIIESPWYTYDSLADFFTSSFSSFSYDLENHSYEASELSIESDDYKMKDVTVKFSYGKISSITVCYNGSYFRFSDIDSTAVTLPSEDKIYIPGKVSKTSWESILLEMSKTLNCEYTISYSYDDDNYSYYLEDTYDVAGDVMKYSSRYEDHKDTSNNYNTDCYYSKEEDSCYKYSKNGDWYIRESCDDYFKDIQDAILLFHDYYDSFTFYESAMVNNPGTYGVSSITIGGKTYGNVFLNFYGEAIDRITYTLDGVQYKISSFTCMEVTLPSENEVYREGKVTESEWKTAIDSAKSTFNFRLTVVSGDSSSSLSESVYLCNGDAIEYTYDSVSENGDSVSKHNYYSLEDTTYYTYDPQGDFWTKTADDEDSPTSSDCFSLMKKYIGAFENNFSDFTFDINKSVYTASSITIDESAYSDVAITFEGTSLKKIEYTLNSNSYVIDEFGKQNVTHPADEDLYKVGKVKKDTWENAFLEAAVSQNFTYSYSDENDNTIDYVLNVSGDVIEKKIYSHDLNTGTYTTTTVYESKVGDTYYLYSESDSKWTKAENKDVKKDFEAISTAIMLFSEDYDEFAYSDSLKGYAIQNSSIDDVDFRDARVIFNGKDLDEIRWCVSTESTKMFENFGKISVTLPTIEE